MEKLKRPASNIEGIPKVLVVDDNPINQMVIVAMLNKIGIKPITACNGEEAINNFDSCKLDIILMDCQMPIMDGFEATRKIRSMNDYGEHIPIIAVTANIMPCDKEKCFEAGMNDYLNKPLDKDTMHTTLEYWLPGFQCSNQEASVS